MWNLVFLISGLLFNILLMIVFFFKEVIDNNENKLFKMMILTNFFGYLVEISLQLLTRNFGIENFVVDIFSKVYLIYVAILVSLFNLYVIITCIKVKKYGKYVLATIILILIYIALFFNLPVYKYYDSVKMYSYGPAVELLKIIHILYIFFWSILVILNYKRIKSKEFIPIFMMIFLIIIAGVAASVDSSILIATMTGTFVCYTMFFTLENPDMKMIEQLRIAREEADKANQAKSDFLSNMSHEIRTPLNAIVGFSQALEEEDLPAQAKEEVGDIISASESLLEIVNGILDISKIEANKLDIINTEYSFRKVFKELINLTKARMGDSKLEFKYSMDETIPKVLYGDHARVKQVILNLLTNAVKYTKEGYLDFKVSCVTKDDICRLIISVEDSGIGIKKEALGKLFSKFERLGVEKEITIEGTGLGLAITKKLVELMKGEIVVQSVYGKGSRFTIALDQRIVLGKDELFEEHEQELKMIDCTGKNILVVDDNPVNLKVAKRLLDDYKANITLLGSGFETIDNIKAGNTYDLILMDDMMPKMNGTETMKKLHEIEGFNIPIIALTANAISGMKEKYIGEGFDDYLPKPIQKIELNQAIDKFLGQNK